LQIEPKYLTTKGEWDKMDIFGNINGRENNSPGSFHFLLQTSRLQGEKNGNIDYRVHAQHNAETIQYAYSTHTRGHNRMDLSWI
jgi:hypothetical protein